MVYLVGILIIVGCFSLTPFFYGLGYWLCGGFLYLYKLGWEKLKQNFYRGWYIRYKDIKSNS